MIKEFSKTPLFKTISNCLYDLVTSGIFCSLGRASRRWEPGGRAETYPNLGVEDSIERLRVFPHRPNKIGGSGVPVCPPSTDALQNVNRSKGEEIFLSIRGRTCGRRGMP
jgi:hypothetical protein